MGVFAGFGCALRGVGTLAVTPSLWLYAIAPVVTTILFMIGVLALMERWAFEPLKQWTTESLGGAEWAGSIAYVFGMVVGAVAVMFAFSTFVRLVAAPFLALLADRTIVRLSGRSTPAAPGGPLVRWVLRPLVEALNLLAIKLVVTVLALPLLFVPVVGSVLFWLVSAVLFGVDLVDIALSARALLLPERLRFARAHFGACLGLGIAGSLLLIVPCLNLLLLPGCVVGAVILDRRLSPDFPKPVTA